MVTRDELLRCSIANWYSQYEKHTFHTIIIPLPEEFVSWLLEDGLFLPASNSAFPTRNKQETITAEDDYKDWSTSDEEEDAKKISPTPNFQHLIDAIKTAIAQLGGSVVPKVTWSVPKDATWVAVGNTLKCNTADQVLLLLKSSDRVAHDLTDALTQCTPIVENISSRNTDGMSNNDINSNSSDISIDPVSTSHIRTGGHILALRKWYDLKPGREFRCFVISGQLRGISQRDVSRKYEELDIEYESIKNRIQQFHKAHILTNNSANTATTPNNKNNFTYDCYVPSSAGSAVKIIDFNPAGGTTAPLLFEWEELLLPLGGEESTRATVGVEEEREEEKDVEFRIIREDVAMRPDTALYGVPYDFVDFSEGSALRSLMEQAQRGNDVEG